MSSATVRQFSKGAVLSIAVAASAMAEANSVNVIYAAENALYGAGYDIGRADGWMDQALRNAVREYQSRSGNLSVTGNLDSATLSALGISDGGGRTVSGNVVASKAQALAALGISETDTDAKPNSTFKSKAEPKPKPKTRLQPEPAFTVKELPAEPKSEPAQKQSPSNPVPEVAQVVAKAEPTKPQPVTPKTAPEATQKATAAAPSPASQPQPAEAAKAESTEQKATAVAEPVEAPANQPTPKVANVSPKADPVAAREPTAPTETATLSPEVAERSTELPEEPTSAGRPETEQLATTPEPEKKSRNIFGTLFDFLFGWMV